MPGLRDDPQRVSVAVTAVAVVTGRTTVCVSRGVHRGSLSDSSGPWVLDVPEEAARALLPVWPVAPAHPDYDGALVAAVALARALEAARVAADDAARERRRALGAAS